MQTTHKQRGITLIEVAATSTVLAILVGSAVPSYSGMLARRAVEGAATQLSTDLQFARSQAVARNERLRIGFVSAAEHSCYVIHTGAAGSCSCNSPTEPASCSGAAEELKTVHLTASGRVRLQANVATMSFNPERGTTGFATLRLIGPSGEELRHVVNIMGRTRSCSPGSSIKGYPVC